jgi:hypothetical protein
MAGAGARVPQRWFDDPCELIEPPPFIRYARSRVRVASVAQPDPNSQGSPAKRTRRAKSQARTVRDPADEYGPARIGRCRVRGVDGVCVIPNSVEDFGFGAEYVEECMVVELEWDGCTGWIDDPEVKAVLLRKTEDGEMFIGITDLRQFIRHHVDLGRRTRNPARSVLTTCSPFPGTTITLVPHRTLVQIAAHSADRLRALQST